MHKGDLVALEVAVQVGVQVEAQAEDQVEATVEDLDHMRRLDHGEEKASLQAARRTITCTSFRCQYRHSHSLNCKNVALYNRGIH